MSLSRLVHMWVLLEELLGASEVSSTDLIPAGFCSQRLWVLLPGTGALGCGAWCGAGTPHSRDIPPEFLSTTCGGGTSPFHVHSSCQSGFFSSVVARLPFN